MVNGDLVGLNINQEFQAGPEVYGSVFPEKQLRSDCVYLKSKGFKMVRVPLKQHGSRQIDIDWQRTAAPIVKEYFESVSFGSGQNAWASPTRWEQFYDFILNNEVPWAMTKDFDENDYYYLGNETESTRPTLNFESVWRKNNQIYCKYSNRHFLETGWGVHLLVTVLGEPSGQFTDEKIITVVDDYTFKFNNSGADVDPILNPSSSSNWWYYSTKTVYRQYKRLATRIRQTYPTFKPKLAYSCVQGVTNNGDGTSQSPTRRPESSTFWIDQFAQIGRGDLDSVDLNVYSHTMTEYTEGQVWFKAMVNKGIAGFGVDHFRVTEWNLWHNTGAYYSNTKMTEKNIAERMKFLEEKGVRHFFFCWREYHTWLQVLNPHNKTLAEGAKFRDWWYSIIKEMQLTVEMSNGNPISVASAREKPVVIASDKWCINMGNTQQGGIYDAGKINDDLTFLKKAGVKRIRIPIGNPSYAPAVSACRNLVIAAKAMGFYVAWCFVYDPGNHNTFVNTYTPLCLAHAADAQALGVDEVQIANEPDAAWRNPGWADPVNDLKGLATQVKQVFTGVVSHCAAQDGYEPRWAAEGKGDIDVMGYNVYGSFGLFEDFKFKINRFYNAFGVNGFQVTEWNIHHDWSKFPANEGDQVKAVKERYDFLESLGIQHYFFTWNWEQNNDAFSLKKKDGTYRPWFSVFFKAFERELAIGREIAGERELIPTTP